MNTSHHSLKRKSHIRLMKSLIKTKLKK